MNVATPQRPRPPRLNPFAFPSDTTFRFVLLIVAVLGASLFIYTNLFIRLNFTVYQRALLECASTKNGAPFTAPTDPRALPAHLEAINAIFECMVPVQRWVAVWTIGGVALLIGAASVLYWLFPTWQLWRRRLALLTREDAPEVTAFLADLGRVAGLSRPPLYVWDPLNTTSSGLAFGRPGRYYVALSGGLVTQFYSDRPRFRAIVLHELAHLRNADIDKTYLSVTIWWAFVFVALVPFALALFGEADIRYTVNVSWRVIALAVLIYLTRNAILRARERYADVRASVWDSPAGALGQILERLSQPVSGRWRTALHVHPDPVERREALDHPERLLYLGFWDAVGTGVVAAVAYQDVEFLLWEVTVSAELPALAAGLIFGLLLVGVIGFGAWRATFASLALGQAPRSAATLGFGVGLGALLGRWLGLRSSLEGANALPWAADPITSFGLEAMWGLLFLVGLFFFLTWIGASASTWLEVAETSPAPVLVCTLGVAAAGGVLAVWLWLIGQRDVLTWLVLEGGSLGILFAVAVNNVLLRPQILAALISLWAFPLAAWFWHGRPATASGSSWAFLDPTPRHLALLPQPPLRPRLALRAGIIGGLVFFGLLLALRIWWHWCWWLPEATCSAGQTKLLLYYGQIVVAVLLQVGAAVIVAGWVRRLGALHGLFAAFVAGCVMTIAILGLNLAFGGTFDLGVTWLTFALVVNVGALLALPSGLAVAALAGWVRRVHRISGGQRAADATLLEQLLAETPAHTGHAGVRPP